MLKSTLAITTIMVFFGCTSKDEKKLMELYTDKKSYYKKLQKTEKTQLYNQNNETKATLTAMYLYKPSKFKNDKKQEQFIVGVGLSDVEEYSIKDIFGLKNVNNPDYLYQLTLNGEKAIDIKKLSIEDSKLENLALISEWNKYYLITFEHSKKKRFKLIYESPLYGKGELYFAKVSKFVFDKQTPIF